MNGKLLSIVVLNWNRLHFSKQTIENLLQKTTVPHEFIFVDNNSAESTGVKDYLKSIKGNAQTQRIELVFNTKNLGTGGGRNTGLAKAQGDYLLTIDDDILVPDHYDTEMIAICDTVPALGLTGINVEPYDFAPRTINGVTYCQKNGNLGEACACMPRKVFNTVGYYNYFSTYGGEGAAIFWRLKKIGLICAYAIPKGIHLDTHENKDYFDVKIKAQTPGSIQLEEMHRYLREMERTGNVYVPFNPNYIPPDNSIFTDELVLKGTK